MNPHRRFWDELLLVVEESLAAFGGVSPDLIESFASDSKHLSSRHGAFCSSGQKSSIVRKILPFEYAVDKSSIKGGEEVWRADCN